MRINPFTLRFNLCLPEVEGEDESETRRGSKISRAVSRHISEALQRLDSVTAKQSRRTSSEDVVIPLGDAFAQQSFQRSFRRSLDRVETYTAEPDNPLCDDASSGGEVEPLCDYVARMKLTVHEMEKSFLADNDMKCLSHQRKILRIFSFFTTAMFVIFCFLDNGKLRDIREFG